MPRPGAESDVAHAQARRAIDATIGRALTPDEKIKLLETASLRPEWETAYWAAILALNTTMRGCEIKSLRWRDINLLDGTLIIPKSKTEAGERMIPLMGDAYEAMVKLRARAEAFGPVEPSHFVFASFKPVGKFNGKALVGMYPRGFDPTRPIGSWKKAWRKLTDKAGLKGLRFHDLRHHAITELAESGTSDQTIMAIAGHVRSSTPSLAIIFKGSAPISVSPFLEVQVSSRPTPELTRADEKHSISEAIDRFVEFFIYPLFSP